ncbi:MULTISPECIES: Rpn family recombination-promoting nuclease/putative transposase [Pantoea]|nr:MULTISPECIES: Rpn family recombination-promoting nuclease/putative transposase [Pantoea]
MQNNSTSTPHEAVFKPFLSHPQAARDLWLCICRSRFWRQATC